jgi:hypothetical protein
VAYGYAWVFPRGEILVIGVGGPVSQGPQLKQYHAHLLSHLGLGEPPFPLPAHLVLHRVTPRPIMGAGSSWRRKPTASYQFAKLLNYLGQLAFRCLERHDYPWEVFCRVMRADRSFGEIKKRCRPDILFPQLLIKSYRNRPIT